MRIIDILLVGALAFGGSSCKTLQQTATMVPYEVAMDLVDPVEVRLELWLDGSDEVFTHLAQIHAWPEGEDFLATGSVASSMNYVCDTHDKTAPLHSEDPTSLAAWLRSTEMLREWFTTP